MRKERRDHFYFPFLSFPFFLLFYLLLYYKYNKIFLLYNYLKIISFFFFNNPTTTWCLAYFFLCSSHSSLPPTEYGYFSRSNSIVRIVGIGRRGRQRKEGRR